MSHTVLVCDDAIFMRTMISDILTQAGFEVVGEAESGVQAVDKYRQLKPDLVTMDIVMPDMGGIDAVREIVKQDPDAKILMCSAMGWWWKRSRRVPRTSWSSHSSPPACSRRCSASWADAWTSRSTPPSSWPRAGSI